MQNESEKENGGLSAAEDAYSAFSAGVELGGLRNTAQIRILIGFLVKNLNGWMERETVVEILQIHGLANYFDASQAVEEMVKNGSLDESEKGALQITRKGRAAVDELENEIPRSVRERALKDALRYRTKQKTKNENRIDVHYFENGTANVTFTILSKGDPMMTLTLFAADEQQVERIRENILRDPDTLYLGIVSSLYT